MASSSLSGLPDHVGAKSSSTVENYSLIIFTRSFALGSIHTFPMRPLRAGLLPEPLHIPMMVIHNLHITI